MIRQKTLYKYQRYFDLGKSEPRRLEPILKDPNGVTALESFHSSESYGKLLPTNEPAILESYLTGKEIHGITVKTIAEDFVITRTIFSKEIKDSYPPWVVNEIFQQAKKLAMTRLGWIPTFVSRQEDFSEL